MKTNANILRKIFVIPILLALVSCASFVYSSPEMHARVVTPTGEPIEGAIVVASWGIEANMTGASLGQLTLLETVTDQNGEFRFPKWGPLYVSTGTVMINQPTVRFFHPNFVPLVIDNFDGVPMKSASSMIKFRLQDQAITLEPFHGTPTQYEQRMAGLIRSLDFFWSDRPVPENGNERCYWKDVPRLLIALQHEKDKLTNEGAGKTVPSIKDFLVSDTSQCGVTRSFYQGYIK